MKQHLLCLAIASALAFGYTAQASAVAVSPTGYQAQNDKSNPFRFMPTKERRNTISQQKINDMLQAKGVTVLEPDITLSAPYAAADQMHTCQYIYGPNEEEWFFTMVPLTEELPGSNEYWKNVSYSGVIFTLYNEKAEKIGSFKGNIPLIEGALKCQSIQVDLSVTKTFYNFDDYYEITLAANYNPKVGYGAKQVTHVFSLNNKEEAQDPICSIPGMTSFEINVGTATAESFIMMYMDYSTWPDDKTGATYTVYTKAGYGTKGPTKMQDFEIVELNGDVAVPMQMTAKGTKLYAASAAYEKPFYGDDGEHSQEGNNYVITLYEQEGNKFNEVKKTKIPVPGLLENFNTSEVSLGTFRGTADITFEYGDGELPCYVLEFKQSDASNNAVVYYAIYDTDGKELKRFGENTYGFSQLSNLTGHEEQFAFLAKDKDGNDVLQMMDWPSLTLGAALPVSFYDYDSGETFNLSNNFDRCLGKNGYYYVCASANGQTNDKNTVHRIAYFDGKGELDHIDVLTFTADVTKVIPWIDASVMDPYLFNSDKNFEYLAWLERKSVENPNVAVKVIAILDSKGNIIAEREYRPRQQYFNAFVSNASSGTSFLCTTYADYYGAEIESRMELISLPINKFEGEGTPENPYIIKTFGDFNQIRNNLTSHFRLAADIDGEGRTMLQIPGVFTGSIDGAGHQVRNVVIAGNNDNNGMFYQIGTDESVIKSFIKDLTFSNLSMHVSFQSFRIKADGMLAYQMVNTRLDNVHLVNPEATADFARDKFSNAYFGGFAARVNGCSFNGCSVIDADFNLPNSSIGGLGGNFIANESEINACAFTGEILGKNNVGGIVGNVNVTTNINDVHVDADITGTYRVGGVIGFADQGPAFITRAIVEGSVKSEEPFMEYTYVPAPGSDPEDPEPDLVAVETYYHYVGGIGGDVYSGSVKNSLVALDELEWNKDNEGYYANPVVGSGAISDCYALNALMADGSEYTDGSLPVNAEELTNEWFSNLGFGFDGNNISKPWVFEGELPALYFEASVPQYIAFTVDALNVNVNTTETIEIVLDGFDNPAEEGFDVYSDNEAAVEITEVRLLDDGNVAVTATFHKEGDYTITATCGAKTATLLVKVVETSGVSDITVDNTSADDTVYNLQGIKVGTSADLDVLPTGFYIVAGQKIFKK